MKKIVLKKEDLIHAANTFDYKKDAAKYLNCSIGVLNKALTEFDVKFISKPPAKGKDRIKDYLFADKKWLIDNWVNTDKSLKELSEEYSIPTGVLESRRVKYKLTKTYKHPLNTDKFFDLEDPHIWYIAGLIATDGYVPKDRNCIELSLTGDSEKDLLQSILDYYEVKDTISEYKENNYRIRIAADGLNEFFESNFSIKSGPKTFDVRIPSKFYSEDCAKAYIRGCIDGDGTISSQGKSFSILTASEYLISGIVDILNEYVDNRYHMRYERGYPTISGNAKSAKLVLDWVYSLPNCFKLDRKFKKYNQVNDIV